MHENMHENVDETCSIMFLEINRILKFE